MNKVLYTIICLFLSIYANGTISSKDIERKSQKLKREILRTKSSYRCKGKIYYVSEGGDDLNSGLNINEPIKSLEKVNSLVLNSGDVVLFKRGDMWRGSIMTKVGVTYSAYGKGNKPRLYGSPYDAAVKGEWSQTETPNVYAYSIPIEQDVAVLIFNHGESNAFKVMKRKTADGTSTLHIDLNEPFSSYADLRRDLDFWHEPSTGIVYLCSHNGNPAKRFRSIEMPIRKHGFYATDDVIIDNFCIKYVGSHGIGSGTTKSLTVRNCEIGWIGGSIQFQHPNSIQPTRYGNGIEIYGGCGKYVIDHCYVYQCYDAGITHQISAVGTETVHMQNVTYSFNLIEDCVYAIEYFVGRSENNSFRMMENVIFRDNILRRTGYGFGNQRPDKRTPAAIKSWRHYNRASNFVIENNIFDRSKPHALHIAADEKEWLPVMRGNIHVLLKGTDALLGAPEKCYQVNDDYPMILQEHFGEKDGVYIWGE